MDKVVVSLDHVTKVHFTYSWGGYSIRYRNGAQDKYTPEELLARFGEAGYERLRELAMRLPGVWHRVGEG